ncbi:hypothetical protein [Streptomyces sp. C184]
MFGLAARPWRPYEGLDHAVQTAVARRTHRRPALAAPSAGEREAARG